MWFNENANELQTVPPWFPLSYVSDEIKQLYFDAGWRQVSADFIPPAPVQAPEENK